MENINWKKIGASVIIILLCTLYVVPSVSSVNEKLLLQINESSSSIQPLFTRETFMVSMRDGIHLATDVYLPDGGSPPHGALFMRTPYNKNGSGLGGWADKGWPAIVQDMRGRFQSEGIDTVFRNAHTDGSDTLDWIGNQNWSNGKIATSGGSAMGIHQYFMAGANPQYLSCQFIGAATPNMYKIAVFQGGQFRKNMIENWLQNQGSTHALPILFAHENYTMDFWTNVSLEDNWQDVNVPAVHMGGWYDCFSQGIIDGFMGYQYQGGTGAQGKSKLIMGPWTHITFGLRLQGELYYPANAIDDFSGDILNMMLDQYILETSTDFENLPNVMYYVMGDVTDSSAPGNIWRYEENWPPAFTERIWYFHENNHLTTAPPGSNAPITYTYNPNNPVPTKGGQNLYPLSGPFDQRSVENRADVLLFTSDVLSEPYEATGPIKARLYVSSNCPDTDFTVKLTDVYPDGRSMLITDGILRMRNRNGFDHWEFVNPGEIYEIDVDLWSSSYIWNIGHRIRIAVSSSNSPRFLANPNTADGINQNIGFNIADNTLYIDTDHPSCIILPEYDGNFPPTVPLITGPSEGVPGKVYTYTFSAEDPETEDLEYFIEWGDGTSTGWIGSYASGDQIQINNTWNTKGTFYIQAKARDSQGMESEWGSLKVVMPIITPQQYSRILQIFHSIIQRSITNS
jgi:predicted acyl esterase